MSDSMRRAAQKEFVKTFRGLVGRYSPWQIWQDMVWMYACAIANSVPNPHRQSREEIYRNLAGKYGREDLGQFARLIGQLVESMEASVTAGEAYGDFLGELYMELELGNKGSGQFFTPFHVCLMMARCGWDDAVLRGEIGREGFVSVNDCACGGGAMLIAFAQVCREKGVNYQQDALFVGQDIDGTTALMCYIQLSLLGCAGYVHIGDTLAAPMTGDVLLGDWGPDTWYTPMYYSDTWQLRQIRAQNRRFAQERAARAPTVALRSGDGGQLAFDFGEATT